MNRQIDKKKTKQVLIDVHWHKYARVAAAEQGRTVKSLVEEGLELVLGGYISNATPKKVGKL